MTPWGVRAAPCRYDAKQARKLTANPGLTTIFPRCYRPPRMRHRLEYAPVWLLLHAVGLLPRPLARAVGVALGRLVCLVHGKLRRVGRGNLELAFPEMVASERRRILKVVFNGLGRQLAEFCLFPRYTRENVEQVAVYQGFENFEAARQRGK